MMPAGRNPALRNPKPPVPGFLLGRDPINGNIHPGMYIDDELEDWMAAQHDDDIIHTPFDEAQITRGSEVSNTFMDKLSEGKAGSYGRLKYLIRVVDY